MVLTDELFERGKNQKEKCTIINDDYVLLKKKMPCTDEELQTYINNIRKAKDSGINICSIVDYRLIDGTTSKYTTQGKDISYTAGVFIEDRAKGTTNDGLTCEEYISDLEKRASADQIIYDKFVQDYVGIFNFDLTPDPKPTNFFFDEKEGFSIIDVIDVKNTSNQYLARYIITAAFGYGIPVFKPGNILTESMYARYCKAKEEIFHKVVTFKDLILFVIRISARPVKEIRT